MYTFTTDRLIVAPADIVWAVIADVEGYARHAPNLDRTYIVHGSGVGMVRHCVDVRGAAWDEECVAWDEGRGYIMQIDTRTYPYPMRSMRGIWAMDEASSGVRVSLTFEYQPRFDLPLIGPWRDRRTVRPAFAQFSRELMDNWETEIHNRAGY